MFFSLFSSKRRDLFARGLHLGKQFTSPGVEDIIFKSVCVNLRQKKWEFLERQSSSFTNSLLSRVFREFRSSPQLLLDFYKNSGIQRGILDYLQPCCMLVHVMVGRKDYDGALCLLKELMISKGHLPLEVLEALVDSSSDYPPSVAVFDALVRACTEIKATDGAYKVIDKLGREGNGVSIHAWNNFLNHLVKMGQIDRFWKVYREMMSYKYFENVNTFNLLMYALCTERKMSEACSVFYRMLKSGVWPNIVGVNMLVDGACRAEDLHLADKLVKNMGTMSEGLLSPNVVTYNCLINGYCKLGKPEIAETILDEMTKMGVQPNLRSYATLVDGYSRNGCLEESFRLCDDMVERGLMPNSVVYNSIIHWLYIEGDTNGASFLLSDMMEKNISPDKFTHSITLKVLCLNGQINEALRVHQEIVEKNLMEDSFSHNILINYLVSSKNVPEAEQLLCNMFVQGFIPDTVTYGTVIGGYCKERKTDSAVRVYTDMIKNEKNPNLVVFNSILDGLCKEGSLDVARCVVDEMRRLEMYDVITYNTLLSGYCSTGSVKEALRLFMSMRKGGLSNEVTYNIMINLFCKLGLFDQAKSILSIMLTEGLKPDYITYTTLVTNLSMKSNSEEAIEMHDNLVLLGVSPDSRTYDAIVSPHVEETSV